MQGAFAGDAKLIMLDEIHKYHDWKNHVKGLFDKHKGDFSILVTGSAGRGSASWQHPHHQRRQVSALYAIAFSRCIQHASLFSTTSFNVILRYIWLRNILAGDINSKSTHS